MGAISANNLLNVFDTLTTSVDDIFSADAAVFANFTTTTPPAYSFVQALAQTMHNYADLLDASLFLYGLNILNTDLEEIESIGLSLTAQDTNYLSSRSNGVASVISSLTSKLVVNIQPISVLSSGNPMLGDIGYETFMATFASEVPPSNVGAVSDIYTVAADEAAGWERIRAALLASGASFPTSLADVLDRMSFLQTQSSNFLSTYITLNTSGSLSLQQLWNMSLALPVYQDMSAEIWNDPSNQIIQSCLCLRYILNQAEMVCWELLLSVMASNTQVLDTAKLYSGQSLMDVANKALGDFNQWQQIAITNGLLPPYTSATPGPNVASTGDILLLPGQNSATPAGNYLNNFLGVDINIGPPGGVMPPWAGDFQTVNGFTNLRWALARRILTPITGLLYHPDYGSYVSTYLGKPLTATNANIIIAYVNAALLSDTRVKSVVSLVPVLLTGGQGLGINYTVQPQGANVPSTTSNLVLYPNPA